MKVIARFIGTLFAASLLIFALMRVVPGNPARVVLGVNATEEKVEALTATLGLDRPWPAQYWEWISGLLTGNFGKSLSSQTDITPLVIDRAQVSLILVLSAMVLALLIAVPLGVWGPRWVINAASLGVAVPSFLVGIAGVAIFAVHLGWLPANGWAIPAHFGDFLRHLIMPVVALALVQGAILARYVRSAVLDVEKQDYIRTARSLGMSRMGAIYRHGLRNAALPVLTVAGLQLTTLVVGAVVIESVFVIPGLGSMLLDAVAARDLTTVQTLVMLLVAFTLVVNLLTELAYRAIDPRLKGA